MRSRREYYDRAASVRRPLILAAVMLVLFIIGIEATIVSTAMPPIAEQLGQLVYNSVLR